MTEAIEKSYVQADKQVPIVCPECGYMKLISLEGFNHPKTPVKFTCKCGHKFKRQLEFRKSYRKATDLLGTCLFKPFSKRIANVKLVNLSMGGACLKARNAENYYIGSMGSLEFTLDNHQNTSISKQVVIRSLSKDLIHCEFISDKAYDKNLGFYLRT